MANANAQTHDIDLASPNLNLDKYKLGVSQFDGFNYRNSPFISHEIKNLYTNTKSADVFIDEDNDEYQLDGYNFKKNGQTIRTFKTKSYIANNELTADVIGYSNGHITPIIADKKHNLFFGYSSFYNAYFFRISDTTYVINSSGFENYVSPSDIYNILDAVYDEHNQCVWCVIVKKEILNNKVFVIRINNSFTLLTETSNFFFLELGNYTDESYDYVIHYRTSLYNKGCLIFCNRKSNNGLVFLDKTLSYLIKKEESGLSKYVLNNLGIYVGGEYIPHTVLFVGTRGGLLVVDGDDYRITSETHFTTTEITNSSLQLSMFSLQYYDNDVENHELDFTFHNNGFSGNADFTGFNKTNTDYPENYFITYNKFSSFVTYAYKKVNDNMVFVSAGTYGDFISFCCPQLDKSNVVDNIINYQTNNNTFYIRLLMNGSNIYGISVSEKKDTIGSIVIPNYLDIEIVDIIYTSSLGYCEVIYKYNSKLYSIYFTTEKQDFSIVNNRYLIFMNAEFYNAYDTKTDKWFHCASDFNIRFGLTINSTVSNYSTSTDSFFFAAANSAFYEVDKNPFPSIQRNSVVVTNYINSILNNKKVPTLYFIDIVTPPNENYICYGVDFFSTKDDTSNTPSYDCTIINKNILYKYEENDNYTNTEGNLLLPIPLYVKSDNLQVPMIYNEDIGFNAPIHIQNGSPTGLYFLLAAQIDAEYYFTIQTQLYCIIDDWICSYTYKDGIADNIKRVANVYGLDFLCATPLSAFFWSRYNKTIYQFQGDALLHRGQCIDEIERIYQVKYNSATNDIIMCCDAYTIVLSEQYAFKVANEIKTVSGQTVEIPYTDVFWTNTDLCLRNTDHILMIRYNASPSPYRKQNIIVKTQLYGLGDNMLSETDCVFIRVFNAENETGSQTVKVGGFTLTDKKTPLLERTFTITSSDWTDDGSYYIRYQPTYQKALGIQIEIESTVPITYIGVSNIPDTKMITKL